MENEKAADKIMSAALLMDDFNLFPVPSLSF